MHKTVLLSLVIALIPLAANATLPTLVEQALANMGVENYASWGFTREVELEGMRRDERYDPQQTTAWRLIAIDQTSPNEKQEKEFMKDAAERDEDDHPGDLSPEGFIDLSSLQLLEEHTDYVTYSFALDDVENPELTQYLTGIMTIKKDTAFPYVTSVQIKNKVPFSPQFGIKIHTMENHFEMSPLSAEGPVFITKLSEKIQGRLMGVMPLDDARVVRYKEFVAPENSTAK